MYVHIEKEHGRGEIANCGQGDYLESCALTSEFQQLSLGDNSNALTLRGV